MKVGKDTSTTLGQTKFTITKLCDQNVNIALTPFYDVNQKKTYTYRVNLNGSNITLVTGNDLEPVNIVEVECFAIMGYLTDRVGPAGPVSPAGRGIILDDDDVNPGNPEAGEPQDDNDAVTKSFLDDQFTPVMMTRNVFSKGNSMQDGRIERLPDPASELDAARKTYVDDRDKVMKDEMKNFSRTEDQKLTQKIKGDKFKSIHTKNMLNLKAGDFSTGAAQFNTFIFGEYRDFTQKYHNSKAHVVCSLISNMGLISVDIGALKPGKYGLRVEGIIDPKDDGSRFDIDTRTFTTPKNDNKNSIQGKNRASRSCYGYGD